MSFNRLFFFSLFILLFSATAMSQSVSLSDTVSIADTELTLLSNTSQCLTDCEAWLEWDLREAVSDKRASTKSDSVFGFEFLKKSNKTKTLKSFGIEVWKEFDVEVSDFGWVEEIVEREPLDVTGKTVACKDIGCVDGKKSGLCDCVGVVWKETGSHFEKRFNKVANTPYNFNFKKGNKYRFRVWGKKNPQLGENDVDWIPTILGERISEWAWWSSNWDYYVSVTISNTSGTSVTDFWVDYNSFNASTLIAAGKLQADYDDLRVVIDGTDVNYIIREYGKGTDSTHIMFPVTLATGSSKDVSIYYGNAAASAPTFVTETASWVNTDVAGFTVSQAGKYINIEGTKVGDSWYEFVKRVEPANRSDTYFKIFYDIKISTMSLEDPAQCAAMAYQGDNAVILFGAARNHDPFLTFMIWDRTDGSDTHTGSADDDWIVPSSRWDSISAEYKESDTSATIDMNYGVVNKSDSGVDATLSGGGYKIGFGGHSYDNGQQTDCNITNVAINYQDASLWLTEQAEKSYGNTFIANFEYEGASSVDNNSTHVTTNFFDLTSYDSSSVNTEKSYRWDFNGSVYSYDQNISRLLVVGEDYNVCLDINALVDGIFESDINCQIVNVNYGVFGVHFYDENTGIDFVPTTLTVNGTSYVSSVESNGQLTLNIIDFTQPVTIIASSATYTEREWVFDLDIVTDYNYSLAMLEDANGGIINFKFYDTDESTILANATIQVMIEAVNYASSKQTNASGEVSFFLNPDDANYSFHIIKADETTLDYYQPTVTIKIPKDEETLATLTAEAFDVQLGGVASRSYLGNTTDLVFKIFPNTVDYYQAQVDYNSAAYLSRTYSFKTKGDTSTITIQPYLPKTANGATIYFYVIDSVNSDSIEGVLVEASRTGGVLAGKTVEQEHTDSSGAAIFSLLINEQYRMNFFIDGDLVYSIKLVATSTTYTVRIDRTGGGSMTDYVDSRTFVEFIPGIGYLESAGGIIGFDVNIFSPTGIISDVNITVFQDGNFVMNIYGSDSDGNYFVFSIDLNSLDSNHAIVVDVNIFKTSGITEHYSHVYIIKTPSTYNILYTLRSAELREELGGDLALNVIAFFITLFVVASFGITVTTKFEGLFAIAAVVMFFFVYIGWVNGILYGLALVGGFSAVIASKRFG